MKLCALCKVRKTTGALCVICKGVKPKRQYTRINLPGFENMTLHQRASAVIGVGPLQQPDVGARHNTFSVIRQQDVSRTTICSNCGKLANLESVCYNILSGTTSLWARCPHCKHKEDRMAL